MVVRQIGGGRAKFDSGWVCSLHRIEWIDWDGDEFYPYTHLYLHFDGPRRQPYKRLGLCEKGELDGWPYYTEVTMKKASRRAPEDLRPVYKRADFGTLVRGKYAQRLIEATNVVVLDPKVAKAFPNDRAVNKALRGLLRDRKSSARPTTRSTRTRRERRAG
jgi:hypothetical protein